MVLRVSRLVAALAWVAMVQVTIMPSALAIERSTADYIALVFEAEDDDSRGERWILMNSATPEQENDPDGNHSDGAVGGAYIELLPDLRVTHADPFGVPISYWGEPGTGPQASYTINFPDAGRYYAHIRAFSTGSEDNGIHLGINGSWPDSAERLQFCTAGDGWQWSGRQRDSGGAGSCGVEKTIWITVPEAGEHTFMISAREDGFEADRIMLIKDLSNNTRICSPSGSDDIVCVDGSLENVDDVSDVAVTSTISQTEIGIDESVVLSVVVRNIDLYDSASDVVLSVGEGFGTRWSATQIAEGCEEIGTSITCDMGTIEPAAPGEEGNSEFEFTLEPLQSGTLEIPVSVATSSIDGAQGNDVDNRSVVVLDDSNSLSALSWQWPDTNISLQSGVETRVVAIARNTGPGDATDVVVNVTVPSGLTVSGLPSGCTGTTVLQCNIGAIAVQDQILLDFGITPAAEGLFSVSVIANASNHNGEGASSSIIINVEAAPEVEDTGGATAESIEEGVNPPAAVPLATVGALVWWMLMLLTLALYVRQAHMSRLSRQRALLPIQGGPLR